ncbi:MAG TPA: regulatory iron-sulfur-containing complex subunit RicT [Phycisphaerae bacterium]|nr:regulatory iron-sulfur-containing complex subunit RicT [Phycisphaerae bacterium]HOJ74673.1 regulatory iron-sulfur-containing complex subunit RicT [Phycisphaerae bacterium]HOM50572.1 regulatory iron-sulfur-containing complex subunit RicT [Phycisphaerae bacterium]HON65247.1 regulatory iron-sulfur-containing complex subunit RicT [Phycisphaerae bacterium]HOQ84794.1 regulatory iron-sulfur-containing complex subunit RicT [Phycisphaerae bacterium]
MSDCGGCASARDRCGNGLEKVYPTTAVRYGKMGYIGEFTHDRDLVFTCGGKVVIQTDRGIEIGEQVSLTCSGCEKSVSREQMRAYAKASGNDSYRLKNGHILREATPGDLAELRHINEAIFDKIQTCRRLAQALNLPMKIVDAEHIFGGERIIFYFMAEDRIDFRELVRQLAREFQTRIEMRQVGARDEARLLADYETCGRECCCKNFLKTLKPVGMQMAKLQKATLDPSKVSGRCGRLKCCLRFEHETYSELNKRLPRVGRWVRTQTEIGVVIDRQILTQLLKLRTPDGTVVTVCEEDLIERDLPPPPLPQPGSPEAANGNDRRRADGPASDARNGRRERPGRGPREGRPGDDRRSARADAKPIPANEKGQEAPPPEFADVDDTDEGLAEEEPELTAAATEDLVGPESDEMPTTGEGPARPPEGPPRSRTERPAGGPPRPPGQRKGRGRRRRRRGGGKGPGAAGPSPNPK